MTQRINGDGKPDPAVTACGQNPNVTLTCQLLVYLGNGGGTFSQSAKVPPYPKTAYIYLVNQWSEI